MNKFKNFGEREYIEKYITKFTHKDTETYRVWINKNDLQVSEYFETLEKAKAFRDEALRLCEIKRLEIVKIDLGIKEYPYNLIEALKFDVESVIRHFEERLESACENLTEREKFVIEQLYKEQKTLEETGKEINVSRERIRQISAKALRKLKYREKYFELGEDANPEVALQRKINEYIEENKASLDYETAKAFIEEYEPKYKNSDYFKKKIPIEELNFSVRTYNCLKRRCINTLDEIIELTMNDLMKIRNLGRISLKEIIDKAREYGFDIKGNYEEYK